MKAALILTWFLSSGHTEGGVAVQTTRIDFTSMESCHAATRAVAAAMTGPASTGWPTVKYVAVCIAL